MILKKPTHSSRYLVKKRTVKTLHERHLLKRRSIKQVKVLTYGWYLAAQKYLLEGYGVTRKNKNYSRKVVELDVPATFSLFEDPNGVLNFLKKVTRALTLPGNVDVSISHAKVERADFHAEALLANTCRILRNSRKKGKSLGKLNIRGDFPENPYLKTLLKEAGLPKLLGADYEYDHSDRNVSRFITSFRVSSNPNELQSNLFQERKTRAQGDLLRGINDCLMMQGWSLTAQGTSHLGTYFGEIIENAERHSKKKIWEVHTYLDHTQEEKLVEILIFNFGATISDTIEAINPSFPNAVDRSKYLGLHKNSGFSDETLRTVFALQENVSCRNNVTETHNGTGTIAILDFFDEVSQFCTVQGGSYSEMLILSGKTGIFFDNSFDVTKLADHRTVVALNELNDLKQPPEKKYIKNIRNCYFPGVAIAIKFKLDHAYLVKGDFNEQSI